MKQESNIENKPLITSSRLFLEVSSVIGKVAALEELTKAYRGYEVDKGWYWEESLGNAFLWNCTPQGISYWYSINKSIEENAK